jgi:group I intron endonuclease
MKTVKQIVYTLYKVTCPSSKIYVGLTKKPIKQRRTDHIYYAEKGSPYLFHAAIRKYGSSSFNWEVLGTFLDRDVANEAEKAAITAHNSHRTKNGYNMTIGGKGVSGIYRSDEQRSKISLRFKGKIGPNKGRKFPPEFSKKISEAKKGNTNRRKKVVDDLGNIFEHSAVAAEFYGVGRTAINEIIMGRNKRLSKSGRSFSYLTEEGGG